ncbi:endonuclease domain-containing protein [Mycobacterium shigaense]|uniref:endonuclease domain-containing protein n=1 Tax=Mycobacterium shigaense TaxID=722731 RepID=UPI003B8A79C7
MMDLTQPFIGTEALASGKLKRHQLRMRYRAILPNVYVAKDVSPSLHQRIAAAWLWSRRRATIAGAAAAALHGVQWIPDNVPVELAYANPRAPQGVLTRRGVLKDSEIQTIAGYPVTTPERTAFDIGRRGAVHSAVTRLDALARATGFKAEDVLRVAQNHPRSPGLRSLETALELVDPGAQSPRESYLRLLLIDAGLPRPQTQIPVLGVDGMPIAYLDLGWPEHRVAVEYDGDEHRSDRRQYVKDVRRQELLEELGWTIVRVVAEDGPAVVLRRVRAALSASGVR